MQTHKRIEREHKTISKMIGLYCHAHHHTSQGSLCENCQFLLDYAHKRIDRCPFGWQKPTCTKCPVHCYKPDRREEIRQVMRYAGPRIILHHPILTLLHFLDGLKAPSAK